MELADSPDMAADDLVESTSRLLLSAHSGDDADPSDAQSIPLHLGYQIQDRMTRLRTASGDRIVGYKIGLTTAASRAPFSADEPGSGRLFASAVLKSPADVVLDGRQLMFEVEVGLLVGSATEPSGRLCAAIEIVSSRWRGGAPSVGAWAADNAMATAAIIGADGVEGSALPTAPRAVARLGNQTWEGRGGPVAENVAWLHRHLARRGVTAPPDCLVLTGAILGPHPVPPGGGLLTARVDGVGSVEVRFGPK